MRFHKKKLDDISEEFSSDYSKKNRKIFIEKLLDFRTSNQFERNLLQGIIKEGDEARIKPCKKIESR